MALFDNFMTNQQKIDDYFNHSAGKTRGRIPHENVLRWLNEKDAENARLREAAQAVVDRWETPLWKDAEPTAAVIYRLRSILSNDQSHQSQPGAGSAATEGNESK